MDDRELLELAAKAAGLPERGWMGTAVMYVKDNTFTDWNPLADDGDEARLESKLYINIEFSERKQIVTAWTRCGVRVSQAFSGDRQAARRRAGVRAAAEIGKTM